jgi:hypothetical protein
MQKRCFHLGRTQRQLGWTDSQVTDILRIYNLVEIQDGTLVLPSYTFWGDASVK